MMETFRAAHDYQGAAFVEIYQNCNVFNDGAFSDVIGRERREQMLINLVHGEPIRFGPEGRRGVVAGSDGALRIVDVDDVGVDALVVHDAERTDPSLAFALARLSKDDHSPTPMGVFRNVARPEYSAERRRAVAACRRAPAAPATSPRCCAATAPGESRPERPQIGRSTRPVRSFGVKNVDFGGINSPSVAVRRISVTLTGRIRIAASARPEVTASTTSSTPC